jgi:hypothetical protein
MIETTHSLKKNAPGVKPDTGEPEKRVFLNDRGEATFICPVCDKGVIKDLSKFSDVPTAVRLKCKCSCGYVYRVLVERRNHYRKQVNLMGRFIYSGNRTSPLHGLLRVHNISQSGIQFTINTEPTFAVGDKLTVELTLDDGDRSQISVDGIVKRIDGNIVGFAFNTTEHYGQFGKYLFR